MYVRTRVCIACLIFLSSCRGSHERNIQDEVKALISSHLGKISWIECRIPSCFDFMFNNIWIPCVFKLEGDFDLGLLAKYSQIVDGKRMIFREDFVFSNLSLEEAYNNDFCRAKGFFSEIANDNAESAVFERVTKAPRASPEILADAHEVLFLGNRDHWGKGNYSLLYGATDYEMTFAVWSRRLDMMCIQFYNGGGVSFD